MLSIKYLSLFIKCLHDQGYQELGLKKVTECEELYGLLMIANVIVMGTSIY